MLRSVGINGILRVRHLVFWLFLKTAQFMHCFIATVAEASVSAKRLRIMGDRLIPHGV